MKILVADDSRVMRQIVKRTLRQAGYTNVEICEAGNGTEALEVIVREAPDLVLCDWNMPEMNGIELLTALRAGGRNVAFGFVTSEGSPAMRERAQNAGALFLIAKPFTPEAFREVLEPVLG
jgi:two-component system, chemotaxis family, chemotaxis protein CheY